jgi:hypothetical protein
LFYFFSFYIDMSFNVGVCRYLGIAHGPTDTVVYAAVSRHSGDQMLAKVIEVVFNILRSGDFKVGQLHATGEYLIKCSTAEAANRLHLQVKKCGIHTIGFRKMKYVHVVPECWCLAQAKISDAAPEEYKLPVEPKLPAPVVAASEDEASGVGASDGEAGGSKKRKL